MRKRAIPFFLLSPITVFYADVFRFFFSRTLGMVSLPPASHKILPSNRPLSGAFFETFFPRRFMSPRDVQPVLSPPPPPGRRNPARALFCLHLLDCPPSSVSLNSLVFHSGVDTWCSQGYFRKGSTLHALCEMAASCPQVDRPILPT